MRSCKTGELFPSSGQPLILALKFKSFVSKTLNDFLFEGFLKVFLHFWGIGISVNKLENLRQFSCSLIKIICRPVKMGSHCYKTSKYEGCVSRALNHSDFERFLKIFLSFWNKGIYVKNLKTYGNSRGPILRSLAELRKWVSINVELSNFVRVFQKHLTTLMLKGFFKYS